MGTVLIVTFSDARLPDLRLLAQMRVLRFLFPDGMRAKGLLSCALGDIPPGDRLHPAELMSNYD